MRADVHKLDYNFYRFAVGKPALFSFQTAIMSELEKAIFRLNPVRDYFIRIRRQMGKNEIDATLAVRMLAAFSEKGGNYYRAGLTAEQYEVSRQRINGIAQNDPFLRLKRVEWTRGGYLRYKNATIQLASVSKSTKTQTTKVGSTISIAGSFDEFHLANNETYQDTFRPMRGMTNAPFFHWGIAGQKEDALYQGICRALGKEPQGYIFDAKKGVFQIPASYCVDVLGENHASSQAFLAEIALFGNDNPFILTNYELIDIASISGFLSQKQIRSVLESDFERLFIRSGDFDYVLTVDIAGGNAENENDNPEVDRDSTAICVWRVQWSETDFYPLCHLVNLFVWTDIDLTTQETEIFQIIDQWQPYKIIVDARGIGNQIASFLKKNFARVNAYHASNISVDQDINYFKGMISNNRIKVFRNDSSREYQQLVTQLHQTQQEVSQQGLLKLAKGKALGERPRIDIVKAMSYLPRALGVIK